MLKIKYTNGFYDEANKLTFKDFGQVDNAIIMVQNDGFPFSGTPDDLARDAISHINEQLEYEIGAYPVIQTASTITIGEALCEQYTNKVIFQANFNG